MSHFTQIQTQFVDQEALQKALADLGFPSIEIHEPAQPLVGFAGDLRPERAELIIRRQFISPLSNDLGFKRGEDGVFQAIISEYDRQTFTPEWLTRLAQRYAYHLAVSKLARQGFQLVEETQAADGQIHLVLRRPG